MKADKLLPKPIRMYYALSNSVKIESGMAIRLEDHGRTVRFSDGGWNPSDSCFLTKAQVRRFHQLPTPSFVKANNKLAAQIERLAESARRLPSA